MLKTKKIEHDLETMERDLSDLRQMVDSLYEKIDSGMVTYEEFKIVKFFIYLVIVLLCIFEFISITLILTQ